MTTEFPDRPRPNPFVQRALARYRILASFTPASFAAKWPHIGRRRIAIVFLDILRASTTAVAAIARGARGLHLAVKPADGRYDFTPPVLPHENWVGGGEENGQPVPGGVIDNSPLGIAAADLEGKYVKFFSTNGARALQEVLRAENADVFMACLANIETTMGAVAQGNYDTAWLVSGGFYGSGCLEDTVAAGRAISCLVESDPRWHLDDDALMMHRVAEFFPDDAALLAAMPDRQVPRLLSDLDKADDVAGSITGAGLGSIWQRMSKLVVKVAYVDGVPLLLPTL